MRLINPKKYRHKLNCIFQLHLLCFFIGLLTSVGAQDSISHDDRIAEAKAKLLKMIQKGIPKI